MSTEPQYPSISSHLGLFYKGPPFWLTWENSPNYSNLVSRSKATCFLSFLPSPSGFKDSLSASTDCGLTCHMVWNFPTSYGKGHLRSPYSSCLSVALRSLTSKDSLPQWPLEFQILEPSEWKFRFLQMLAQDQGVGFFTLAACPQHDAKKPAFYN